MSHSNQKKVSAFDAKTHLASLIRDVEEGQTFTITRRGKPVARLEPVRKISGKTADELLEGFRSVRQRVKGSGDIRSMIEEGRKY
jgi:prevent-host-death family protein